MVAMAERDPVGLTQLGIGKREGVFERLLTGLRA
jgi:hypothetical protein